MKALILGSLCPVIYYSQSTMHNPQSRNVLIFSLDKLTIAASAKLYDAPKNLEFSHLQLILTPFLLHFITLFTSLKVPKTKSHKFLPRQTDSVNFFKFKYTFDRVKKI